MASSRLLHDPKARANLLSQEAQGNVVETNRMADLDNLSMVGAQRQMMREQDEELAGLESTVLSTHHIALAVNEELDLQTRLLGAIEEDADATNNRVKVTQRKLITLSRQDSGGYSLMCMCVLVLVMLFLLLLALKLLKF